MPMRSNVVFRPTVVIGLGGTGHGAVLKLKRRFIDIYGSVPPIIKLLSFDTTESAEHSEKANDGTVVTLEPQVESHVISVANPAALVSGANPHINEWWPPNIPVSAIIAGAGQVRARGRLALFAKSKDIFPTVRGAVDHVKLHAVDKEMYAEKFLISDRPGIEIYIVGSLAGGTGSGMFLDMAFLTRHFIKIEENSNITGVLVLPRVFETLSSVAFVKSNAYAALKEIEHFSGMKPTDRFTIDYGIDRVEVNQEPFDLLYLIDGTNEEGKGVSGPRDLYSIIADGLYIQIGSQIGADNANTTDNLKAQLATADPVFGRSRKYCSFGVASLTLPVREYERMQIEDSRRLLSDGLLNGVFPDKDLEAEVMSLIADNKLKEDEADDVIDALIERDGGGRLRFQLPFGQMKFDKNAGTTIKQLHGSHRARMERDVAQRLDLNYQSLLDSAKRAFDAWWQQALNRPNGLTYAFRFAEKLKAKLISYQQMMINESKDEQARLKAIAFNTYEEQVRDAGTSLLRRESRVRAACENYKGMVDRECDLYLQVARRDKAAELYGTLRAHLEAIIVRCASIRNKLETIQQEFELRYQEVSARRGNENLFEHTVNFDPGTNRPDIDAQDFIRWYGERDATLDAWAEMRQEDMAGEITAYMTERYHNLTDLTVDDVLRRNEPGTIAQDLKQLARLGVPLWRFDIGQIPVAKHDLINEMFYYGVPNADTTVLKDPKIVGSVPRKTSAPTFVTTLEPHRITLFRVKAGIPLFALQGIQEMERSYANPDKSVSNHLHRDWESFANLSPRDDDAPSLRLFAIAQAPDPFDLIVKEGGWYYIRSQHAKRVEGGKIRLGQGRIRAYSEFKENKSLVKEVEDKINNITRDVGESKVSETLRTYADQLGAQVSVREVEQSIKEQVEGELQAIESYLKQMTSLS